MLHPIVFIWAVFILVTVMARRKIRWNLALIQVEDEDMKIAGDSFSNSNQEDLSEAAARQYIAQKEVGNIEKARKLGKLYADQLLLDNMELFGMGAAELEPVCVHHQMLLYSYAINRVSAEHTSNSMVAQTILNVFYNELEEISPELYQHVCDMAAFSLYILCDRSPKYKDQIGGVYATLCKEPDNPARIEEGNRLYRMYYHYCLRECEQAKFSNADNL